MTSFPLLAQVSDRPTRSRAARAAYAFLLVGVATIAVYLVLPSHAQSVIFVVIGLAGVTAIVVGARKHLIGAGRIPWYLFAAGIAAQVTGDTVTGYYELAFGHEPPVPSVADAFYLGGYPALIAGIVTDSRAPGEPKDTEGSALFQIYQAFASADETEALRRAYADGIAWGDAKQVLLDRIRSEEHTSELQSH